VLGYWQAMNSSPTPSSDTPAHDTPAHGTPSNDTRPNPPSDTAPTGTGGTELGRPGQLPGTDRPIGRTSTWRQALHFLTGDRKKEGAALADAVAETTGHPHEHDEHTRALAEDAVQEAHGDRGVAATEEYRTDLAAPDEVIRRAEEEKRHDA
jgi:hypothetical protein